MRRRTFIAAAATSPIALSLPTEAESHVLFERHYGGHTYKVCRGSDGCLWWKVSESPWAGTAWTGQYPTYAEYYFEPDLPSVEQVEQDAWAFMEAL